MSPVAARAAAHCESRHLEATTLLVSLAVGSELLRSARGFGAATSSLLD